MNEAAARLERNSGLAELVAGAFARRAGARGPKYLSLHAALSELVETGALRPGEQLPSDDELAARLGLSVGTVQKAMAALREDKMLERRQGAGTFVADPAIEMHDIWHFRFLGDDGENFLPLKARAFKRAVVRGGGAWQDHMPAADSFVTVSRMIEVNGEFSLLSDFYFDGERFAGLAAQPLRDFDRVVMRNVLTERYGVRIRNARQLLRCECLTGRDCRILKTGPGSIGMILETFGADQSETPVYYQRVVIPPNSRRLVVSEQV